MTLLEFISKHIVFSFLVICVVFQCFFGITHKVIRAISISKNGYPPPHCDGDGDFKESDNEKL